MKTPASDPLSDSSDKNKKLGDEIITLVAQLDADNDRFLKLIAEFNERKASSGDGIVCSWAHWPDSR